MSLVNEIIKDLLPEKLNSKTTALYAGGFKPPTSGHFEVVEQALKENPEIDEFIIFIGAKERDGISQDESLLIWEIYNNYLPFKVKIVPTSKPPIRAVYNFAKEHPTREVLWVIGAREGNEEDFKDISSRTKSISKYPNLELRTIVTQGGVSGTAARNAAKVSQEKFEKFLPEKLSPEEKEEVYNLVSDKVQEIQKPSKEEDVDPKELKMGIKVEMEHTDDPSKAKIIALQHLAEDPKYYTKLASLGLEENNPEDGKAAPYGSGYKKLQENASYSQHIDVIDKIDQLTKHMIAKGMNIEPLPTVELINGDSENAKEFLGKTAYYDPNKQHIVLYTEGRHPKDIVRSYAHEMIHHIQYLEDRLGDVSTTNTMEDDHLDKIEQEANLKGTMTFRNWTDSLNEAIVGEKIECDNCDWSWDIKDGGGDLFVCHKCGHDNEFKTSMPVGENEEDPKPDYKIYLDMDGVVADFEKRFKDLSGIAPREFEDKFGRTKFWDFIDEENKVGFWVGIPVMDGAKELVDYVSKHDYVMLTAPSIKKQSRLGKILWVRNHTGDLFPSKPQIIFKYSKEKHKVKPELTPTDILIDDRKSTIDNWNNAGGVGILYQSASQTIADLKKIGL